MRILTYLPVLEAVGGVELHTLEVSRELAARGHKIDLFYERDDLGIWLATSHNLKVWRNVRDEPVLTPGPEAYDHDRLALNQIIKRDGVYYAFYHANAHKPWKDWTTNIARSRDLIHWEKYPGNPIVEHNCSSAILVQTPNGDRLYTMHPDVKVFEPAARVGARSR